MVVSPGRRDAPSLPPDTAVSTGARTLTESQTRGLLETCRQLTVERQQIAAVLADLPESVAALRSALNRLHRLVL